MKGKSSYLEYVLDCLFCTIEPNLNSSFKSYSAKGASFLFSIEYSLSQESYFTFATLLLGLGLVFLSGREVGFRFLSGGAKKKRIPGQRILVLNSINIGEGQVIYCFLYTYMAKLYLILFSKKCDLAKFIKKIICRKYTMAMAICRGRKL